MCYEGQAAIRLARSFTSFYRESISVCSQLRATRDVGEAAAGALLGLLGHYGQDDAEEAARVHWSTGKLEPAAASALRPALSDVSVHVLHQPYHLTVMRAPAACVASEAVRAAEDGLDQAAASAVATGFASGLAPPRARRWRNVYKTMITVREAPSIDSPMLDLVQRDEVLEVDAQTIDGTWLRMARVYKDGCGGWVLVDGTPLGYGVLLEAVSEGPATGMRPPDTPTPASLSSLSQASPVQTGQPTHQSTRSPSHSSNGDGGPTGAYQSGKIEAAPVSDGVVQLETLLKRAALPLTYVARLSAAGLPQSIQRCGMSNELAEAAKRAKLPIGHRLKLALLYKEGA